MHRFFVCPLCLIKVDYIPDMLKQWLNTCVVCFPALQMALCFVLVFCFVPQWLASCVLMFCSGVGDFSLVCFGVLFLSLLGTTLCFVVLLVGWLVGWLVSWLVGWLAGWLIGWLAGWLVRWLVGWLAGWLAGWLPD